MGIQVLEDGREAVLADSCTGWALGRIFHGWGREDGRREANAFLVWVQKARPGLRLTVIGRAEWDRLRCDWREALDQIHTCSVCGNGYTLRRSIEADDEDEHYVYGCCGFDCANRRWAQPSTRSV